MTPQQKRLVLPIAILALGLVALIGVGLFIVSGGGEKGRASAVGGAFSLVDQTGARVTDATYRGAPSLVFFGFTHCPDVCPTTLFEISEILRKLPKDARLSALFVTVDPERDTPELMKSYLASFDPRISGLSGTREEIDVIIKAYRVYAKKIPTEKGQYTMDHTAIVYMMDKQGRFVNALNIQQPPEAAAREVQKLL
ncbi:MAG: SCO family protein [Beijerinckiaceae bacterium]|nr:SCO family protein [Beijerinckiaceae bacterium]MBX9757170.1 SCO family protein [Beijerinckiaceae bacterium]MDO9443482.1 SCO family protein [Beijerinckiaceae bacterium]